jgi:hypothetical protein
MAIAMGLGTMLSHKRSWSRIFCSASRTLLFAQCPLYRFDFILDPHKIITVELIIDASMNALDEGAAPTDKLVT